MNAMHKHGKRKTRDFYVRIIIKILAPMNDYVKVYFAATEQNNNNCRSSVVPFGVLRFSWFSISDELWRIINWGMYRSYRESGSKGIYFIRVNKEAGKGRGTKIDTLYKDLASRYFAFLLHL